MTSRIVVLGSLNMDLVIQAPRHPHPGETITGGPFRTIPGGKGANQAVAAARMGGEVSMIGRVGRDAFGDELLDNLYESGVNADRVEQAETTTGVALITVSATGENSIVIAPGANGTVSPELVQANEESLATADVLLLQLEVPMPAVQVAAQIAHHHGVSVILNPAPAQPLPAGLLADVAFVIPNEHEATLLTGLAIASESDAARAAARLRDLGAGAAIITLGAKGALVCLPDAVTHVPSFPVKAVDTTAAGDAFLGAFAVALAEGHRPVEAVRWGCAAGALACTVFGAQPSLPTRAAVKTLLG